MNYLFGILITVVSLHCFVSGQGMDPEMDYNTILNLLPRNVTNLTMEDFAERYLTKDNAPFNLKAYLRTDEFKQSVSNQDVPLASLDACSPRYSTVVLQRDNDPRVFYWPPCTQALRCGGCCPSEMLECAPIETETKSVMVMKLRISSPRSTDMEFVGMQVNLVEHHKKCEPQCKVKPSDCNLTIHDYYPEDCRCNCRARPPPNFCSYIGKRWDEKTCSCVCSVTDRCPGFAEFDIEECRCKLRQSVAGNAALPPLLPTLPPLVLQLQNTPAPCTPPVLCLPGMSPMLVDGTCRCMNRRLKREVKRQKYLAAIRRQRMESALSHSSYKTHN